MLGERECELSYKNAAEVKFNLSLTRQSLLEFSARQNAHFEQLAQAKVGPDGLEVEQEMVTV